MSAPPVVEPRWAGCLQAGCAYDPKRPEVVRHTQDCDLAHVREVDRRYELTPRRSS